MVGQTRRYFRRMGVDFDAASHLGLGNGKLYYEKTRLHEAEGILLGKGKRLGRFAQTLTNAFLREAKKYETFLSKTKQIDFHALPNPALARLYNTYLDRLSGLIPYAFIVSMTLETVAARVITKALVEKHAEERYNKLMIPFDTNVTTKEFSRRLRLAAKWRNLNHQKRAQAVARHLREYGYLTCYRPTDDPATAKDLTASLEELSKQHSNQKVKKRQSAIGAVVCARPMLSSRKTSPHSRRCCGHEDNVWVRTYRRELMSWVFCHAADV